MGHKGSVNRLHKDQQLSQASEFVSSEAMHRAKSDGYFPVKSTGKEDYCNNCESLRHLFTWPYNDEHICIYCVAYSLQETIRDAKIKDWEFYEAK